MPDMFDEGCLMPDMCEEATVGWTFKAGSSRGVVNLQIGPVNSKVLLSPAMARKLGNRLIRVAKQADDEGINLDLQPQEDYRAKRHPENPI